MIQEVSECDDMSLQCFVRLHSTRPLQQLYKNKIFILYDEKLSRLENTIRVRNCEAGCSNLLKCNRLLLIKDDHLQKQSKAS